MAIKTLSMATPVRETRELFIPQPTAQLNAVFAHSAGITERGLRVCKQQDDRVLMQLRFPVPERRGNGHLAGVTLSHSEVVRLRNYLTMLIDDVLADGYCKVQS